MRSQSKQNNKTTTIKGINQMNDRTIKLITELESRSKRRHDRYLKRLTEMDMVNLHDEEILDAIAHCHNVKFCEYLRESFPTGLAQQINELNRLLRGMKLRSQQHIAQYRMPTISDRAEAIALMHQIELCEDILSGLKDQI